MRQKQKNPKYIQKESKSKRLQIAHIIILKWYILKINKCMWNGRGGGGGSGGGVSI